MAVLVTLEGMTDDQLAPLILLDRPPVPEGVRERYAGAVDDVAAWLGFVRFVGEPVLDDDIQNDPSWDLREDWDRAALLDRVGLAAVERVLTTHAGREPLYDRGPAFTMWREPWLSFLPDAPTRAVEVPLPLSRERIDEVLDHQVRTWPKRLPLDTLWDDYDAYLVRLALWPTDPAARYWVRHDAALLEFEGITPDPDEDAAIQAAARAIPPGQPYPASYATYRASRR